jgi:hypothetical protein
MSRKTKESETLVSFQLKIISVSFYFMCFACVYMFSIYLGAYRGYGMPKGTI